MEEALVQAVDMRAQSKVLTQTTEDREFLMTSPLRIQDLPLASRSLCLGPCALFPGALASPVNAVFWLSRSLQLSVRSAGARGQRLVAWQRPDPELTLQPAWRHIRTSQSALGTLS